MPLCTYSHLVRENLLKTPYKNKGDATAHKTMVCYISKNISLFHILIKIFEIKYII